MTIAIAQEKPQRIQSENLILEELRNELMIYDPQRNKAFCLNQTAAFVWKHSDGKTTIAEIASLMEQELQKPANEQMVLFALDALAKDGLLAASTPVPAVPAGVTRRQVLRKMGVGAMALPVVTVLFVSPAKAHASSTTPNVPTGQSPAENANQKGHKGFWAWLEDLF
jgi:Coenzyme PQQ synthesis protein D (PqqD)